MTGKRAAPKSSRGFRRSKSRTRAPRTPRSSPPPRAPTTRSCRAPTAVPAQPTPERSSSLAYAGAGPLPSGPALSLDPPTPATPSGAFAPAGNPSVLPSGVAPLGSRSLARHEARQRSHRLRKALAALLALALIASAVWYVAHRTQAPKAKAPVATGPDSVVLLQVTGADGAGGVALLGDQHGSRRSGRAPAHAARSRRRRLRRGVPAEGGHPARERQRRRCRRRPGHPGRRHVDTERRRPRCPRGPARRHRRRRGRGRQAG